MSRFGFAVADGCPDLANDDKAMTLAARVALGQAPSEHPARCEACKLLGDGVACAGALATPIPEAVEEWMISRLPDDLDTVAGYLLKKAVADYGYEGAGAKELRKQGLLAAPGPYTKHFGPFFRRFTVSTDQLLEEILCAGDIQPAHALTILVHLGALSVDGRVLTSLDDAQELGTLVEQPGTRRRRTECAVEIDERDPEPVSALKRLVRALWAAFVLDVELRVFEPAPAGDDAAA